MPGYSLKEKLQTKHKPAEKSIRTPSVLTRDIHGEDFVPLDMYLMIEDGEREPISLQDALQLNTIASTSSSVSSISITPTKMLFEGDPGVGKSSTLTRILELYATGDLEQFDHAFQIKLDLLINPYWSISYTNHIRMYPLACLVHASLEQIVRARGGLNANFITLEEIIELFSQKDQSRTLFVADGYDKIAHLIGNKSIKDFITQILEFDNVFMSARPNTMVPLIKNAFDNTIIIDGISGESIKLFVRKYFLVQADILKAEVLDFFEGNPSATAGTLLSTLKTSSSQASFAAFFQLEKILKEHLDLADLTEINGTNGKIDEYYRLKINIILDLAKRNHIIKELLSNPMHAAMICMQDIESDTLTLAELYRGVINRLGEKVIPIGEAIKGEPIETLPELLILKRLAYRELTTGELSWDDVNEELRGDSNIDRLLSVGLLESVAAADSTVSALHRNTYHSERDLGGRASEVLDNRTFKFIDRSISEYLAACSFKDMLMLEKGSPLAKEAAEFIASHRHETKYLTFLKFVAGMTSDLADRNKIAITRFWEAVECNIHATVETGIDKPVILWMHLLSQVMIDETPNPRIPNINKIIDIIDQAVLSDFIRWKSVLIESSGYLSPKILTFLEKQVNQKSRNEAMLGDNKDVDLEDYKSDEEGVSQLMITKPSTAERDTSDTSDIILQLGSEYYEEGEEVYSSAHRRSSHAHYQSMSPDTTLAKAAIETYGYLFNLLDNTRIFNVLFSNLSDNEDCRIIKPTIVAITRIIKNHQLTSEQISLFKGKLTTYCNIEYLRSAVGKAFKVIQAEHQELAAILHRSATMEDDGSPNAMLMSASQTTLTPLSPSKRPPLVHADTKLASTLQLSLEKLFSRLKDQQERQYTIKILIDHLSTNQRWLDEKWEIRMDAILKILGHSTDETAASSDLQLKRLALVTKKALQEHIKLANDKSDMVWICDNFIHLQHSAKAGFNYAMKSILYQVLSDDRITAAESKFIRLCIKELQISITIHPPQILDNDINYTIVYDGNTYTLHGLDNAAQVEKIIDTAHANKAHLHELTNTGSGMRIAASEVPCHSIVDRSELSSENALVTLCYKTSHLRSKPTDVFVLVEREGYHFGRHVATKFSVTDEGKIRVSADYKEHPDDIDGSFRIKIFGAMQYSETERIRYLTQSIGTDLETAKQILFQAQNYIPAPEDTLEDSNGLLSTNMFKSGSIKAKKHSKQEKHVEGPLSIEAKITLLYKLIKNLGMDATGVWEKDFHKKDSRFTEHNKEIIDAIDAQHTDSIIITQKELQASVDSLNEFTARINVEALTNVIAKEELNEHAREEMEAIEADTYKYALYKAIVLKINAFYIAVNAIHSEMVKNDKHGAAGKIGTLLGKLGPHVPVLGPVVEFIGELFTEADDAIAEERIGTFLEIALNSGEMAEISDKIGRKLTRLNLENIRPSARNIAASATETVSNLVNNGPAQIIVQACKAFKDNIAERQLDEEDRVEKVIEDLAKEHGEIMVKAIIESIFTKSYDPKFKVGTMMQTTVATATKAYKKDNEFKASAIVHIMKKQFHLQLLDNQGHGERRNSLTGSGGSGDNLQEEGGIPLGLELTGDHPPVNTGSFGCSGGRGWCTIMAVPNIRYNDPAVQEAWETRNQQAVLKHLQYKNPEASEPVLRLKTINYFLQTEEGVNLLAKADGLYGEKAMLKLKNLGLDKEIAEQILSEVEARPEEIEAILDVFLSPHDKESTVESADKALSINHDKLISLYADTQRLYNKKTMIELSKFIQKNGEEANQLLLVASIVGNEAVLKEIFGANSEDDIKEFKTVIAAEYEEGSHTGGIPQYIYNARFGENSILSSARSLIKHITNIYSEFQQMLYDGDYGDKLFALQEQFQLLLSYAEKGQPTMIFRPPYRGPGDDGDHSGGGGGSSGLLFEGNNGGNGEPEDPSVNTLYYDTPYFNESTFNTTGLKLIIKLGEIPSQ